ncbi:hypothetical protein QAD02_017617 [Eretmocerus hayati]|uniref:Uncharacterized protein n=1 Tax=Eretmocerus hayati TaxID=131215 RepID=A0ACC2PJ70_9HYME|nr:hypothetical protein QAD02_017617 [Eretmocerus hayati]
MADTIDTVVIEAPDCDDPPKKDATNNKGRGEEKQKPRPQTRKTEKSRFHVQKIAENHYSKRITMSTRCAGLNCSLLSTSLPPEYNGDFDIFALYCRLLQRFCAIVIKQSSPEQYSTPFCR